MQNKATTMKTEFRLAFVGFSVVPFGSNDLLYYKTAVRALQQGHAVLVSHPDFGPSNAPEYDRIRQFGAQVHRRNCYQRNPHFAIRQWDKVFHKFHNPIADFKFMADWRPDIIVISDSATYHLTIAPGCAEFLLSQNVPFVTISQFNQENSSLHFRMLRRAQKLFSKARACVFVSQRNLEVARRQLCLDLSQAIVVDNPPHLERLDAEPFPEPVEIRMAMVARLECEIKGQALVIEILARSEWRKREWSLDIYGNGPDEQYLRELVDFYDLGDRIKLRGFCPNVREVWGRNMILLMCSSGEGKPLALTEALACGRVAVVTDVGGNAELVQEGINGFVAESATLTSFRSAMERAWEARAKWRSMGVLAHQMMVARLTPPPEQRLLDMLIRQMEI